ncbi:MAG: TIGR03545 family protein [Planctomycetota bacterium]
MIRWRFLFTRLIVIVAVLMLLCLGMGPLTQFITVRGLEYSTGAKADIGQTRVSFFPPAIQYKNLSIADPRDDKEFRDAFTAESINLVVDSDALLRRRWVIERARITGLEIGAQRQSSGHLDEVSEVDSGGSTVLSQWLSGTADAVRDQAESMSRNLQTVQTGDQLRQQWTQKYEELTGRAKALEERVRTIRDSAQGIDNPLRDWPELERTLAEAKLAREELIQIREQMEALPEQMRTDLQRLDEARQADIAAIDRYVPGNLQESESFGVDLVTSEVRRQIERLRRFVDNGRTLANYTVVAPETERVRGEDYDFNQEFRRPDILIRQCEVSGLMRASGKTYTLTGVMQNMTPEPHRLKDPTRAQLKLEGPETVLVDYIRDRRDTSIDRLTLHWPQMRADAIELSGGKDMEIQIAGGQREVWVQLDSQGDDLQGRLVSKQTGVAMRIDLGGAAATSSAAIAMNQSLAQVDQIEIDAAFEGSWKDIDLTLHTNLGTIFRDAAEGAIAKQLDVSKAKLALEVDEVHREQMLALREWMTEQQIETQGLLSGADEAIEEMSQKVLAEVGGADQYLGKLRTAFGKSLR